MNKLQSITGFEDLIIDEIIFEASYPILFTCLNNQQELLLSVCCQNNETGRKWMICKTSPQSIVDLLKNKITIRDAFLENDEYRASVLDTKDYLDVTFYCLEDWANESLLPKDGAYLDAEEGEFDDIIEKYQSMI